MTRFIRFLALVLAVIAVQTAAHAEFLFTVTDLGTLGGNSSSAADVNNDGQVVGASTTPYGTWRGFLYSNGTMIDLGTLGGDYSDATAINDRGQIVGQSTLPSGDSRAFLHDSGVMHDLGTLGGRNSGATDINNLGQVVGWSLSATSSHAFVYVDGGMYDLGALSASDISRATAINDSSIIVGTSQSLLGEAPINGFVFYNGAIHNLSSIGGPQLFGSNVIIASINNSNQIVGGETASLSYTPFAGFLTVGGHTTLLTIPTSDPSPYVFAPAKINNYGLAVPHRTHLYWNGNYAELEPLVDLANSPFVTLEAKSISDNGYIAGTGTTRDGASHAFLLTPIAPAP
jgi:probable HAF family extracellular repeat protein